MPDGQDPLVALGVVARPHGVRGELRVHRYNQDSRVLDSLDRATLRKDDEARPVRILASRPHGQLLLVTLRGVDGRDAADALRGWEICVPRAQLPAPDPDEYYHVDLIGLRAVSRDGAVVGTVASVIRYPSADCLLLSVSGGTREVPLIEPYVIDIDVDGGQVVVDHLEDFDLQADGE